MSEWRGLQRENKTKAIRNVSPIALFLSDGMRNEILPAPVDELEALLRLVYAMFTTISYRRTFYARLSSLISLSGVPRV